MKLCEDLFSVSFISVEPRVRRHRAERYAVALFGAEDCSEERQCYSEHLAASRNHTSDVISTAE